MCFTGTALSSHTCMSCSIGRVGMRDLYLACDYKFRMVGFSGSIQPYNHRNALTSANERDLWCDHNIYFSCCEIKLKDKMSLFQIGRRLYRNAATSLRCWVTRYSLCLMGASVWPVPMQPHSSCCWGPRPAVTTAELVLRMQLMSTPSREVSRSNRIMTLAPSFCLFFICFVYFVFFLFSIKHYA